MPLPTKKNGLMIEVEAKPRALLPERENPGEIDFTSKPEWDPGEYRIKEWNEVEGGRQERITGIEGVEKRLVKAFKGKARYPKLAVQNAIIRLHNFNRIAVNLDTGEVYTKSVDDYDALFTGIMDGTVGYGV